MFIPGWIISVLTFPGVIVHEMAHKLFCDAAKVPVYQVSYFRIGNPAGYVVHGEITKLKDAVLISVGPFIINTLLCVLISFPYAFSARSGAKPDLILQIMLWLGLSIGMHAFPSNQDVNNLLNQIKTSKGKGVAYILALPFAAAFQIANILSVIWFDLIYAVGISLVIPAILIPK